VVLAAQHISTLYIFPKYGGVVEIAELDVAFAIKKNIWRPYVAMKDP
jgi:hypothetical protein